MVSPYRLCARLNLKTLKNYYKNMENNGNPQALHLSFPLLETLPLWLAL